MFVIHGIFRNPPCFSSWEIQKIRKRVNYIPLISPEQTRDFLNRFWNTCKENTRQCHHHHPSELISLISFASIAQYDPYEIRKMCFSYMGDSCPTSLHVFIIMRYIKTSRPHAIKHHCSSVNVASRFSLFRNLSTNKQKGIWNHGTTRFRNKLQSKCICDQWNVYLFFLQHEVLWYSDIDQNDTPDYSAYINRKTGSQFW